MTVEVMTPHGLRVGSAVREVRSGTNYGANGASDYANVVGEAVVVDLGNDRLLFALLRGGRRDDPDYGANIAFMARVDAGVKGDAAVDQQVELYPTWPPQFRVADDKHLARTHADYLPTLVTFRDIHKSETVERVDPNNLEGTLGTGIFLTRILIQSTREDSEKRVGRFLSWVSDGQLRGFDENFKATPYPTLAQTLSTRDMVRGEVR